MKFLYISIFLFSTHVFGKVIEYKLESEKSPVEFEAKGTPSLLSIKGLKGKGEGDLKIVDDVLSGMIIVNLNDFDTDIDTRNEHMKEKYLETGKSGFTNSTLKINSLKIIKGFPEIVKSFSGLNIEGVLSLHGKEKPINCLADLSADENGNLLGKVKFKLKLSDFGIEIPSFAGITIEDEVSVNASFLSKVIRKK